MSKIKRKRQKFSSIIRNNLFIISKVAKFTPEYFIWMIVEGVVWGIINSATAFFSFNLLNAVSGDSNFSYAVKLIAIMAIFNVIVYAFDRWYWILQNPTMGYKLHMKMHTELFQKALTLDLACYDDPEFYNDFVWAMNNSHARAVAVMEDTGKLINRIVASTSLFGLLMTVDPLIAVVMFISSTISLIFHLIGNKVSYKHQKEVNPHWRKKDYINRVYHLSDYSKELRISKADDIMMREYDENTQKIISLDKKYGKKYFLSGGIGWQLVSTVTFFSLLLYMIFQLKNGAIGVGGFVATVNVIWNIRWSFVNLIERIAKYPEHSLFIERYRAFLEFAPQVKGGLTDIPPFESLEFKNVSFSYEFASHPKYSFHDEDYKPPEKQGENRHALKNVSFKLSAGEKIAIVGYNGAGKTTLIKLMMRLYDVSEGEILYNGVNIKNYDAACYRKMIGTVFQDYKIFADSIAVNVMSGEYDEKTDKDTVLKALESADFSEKLSTLKDGINTHLTREFNDEGTNLSGGESQKIAIARVFAEEYPIIIMDEPSSALDPIAEYNLNQSILKSTNNKTVIFISHRLSTTRIADKIYMFSNGELIEQGSHTQLLDMDGKYAQMFKVQSEKYNENYSN